MAGFVKALSARLRFPRGWEVACARLRQAGFSPLEASVLVCEPAARMTDRSVAFDAINYASVLVEGGLLSPFEAIRVVRAGPGATPR